MNANGKTTRKNSPPIKVYCLPDERQQIAVNAQNAGLSLSTYLLQVGIGYRIRGTVDHKQVEELARINGDLGRLGGVLKVWLADDERSRTFGEATLRAALDRISATQERMIEVMARVVRPRGR